MKNNQLNKRPYGTDEIKVAVSIITLLDKVNPLSDFEIILNKFN